MGDEIKVGARVRSIDDYSGHADAAALTRWIAARRPIERGLFFVHGEDAAIAGLSERIAERIVPAAKLFQPVIDDVYELTTAVPALRDVARRRRLTPEAVTQLDWHNEMSELVLDINDAGRRGPAIRPHRCFGVRRGAFCHAWPLIASL
jgi:metallo-beta-lactamase family protein